MARLMQIAGRLLGDSDAGMLLVKQLAYENANAACQAALRPFKKKGNLSDYIRLCSDIGPSYTQGIAIAAALQGKSRQEVMFQQRWPMRTVGPPGSCSGCGQMGHRVKQCPNKQGRPVANPAGKPPGDCPRCKRGKHWANECKSKKDAMGNPLPQGNGRRVLCSQVYPLHLQSQQTPLK